jgi:hypothetical protein
MKDRPKKAKAAGAAGLPPLSPEPGARLKAQVAQVAQALESGRTPEMIRELVSTQPQDPLWDQHLMAALATLAHPAIPPLLAALFGEARDRARRKALKRALHLLQTRGVSVAPQVLPREKAAPMRLGGGAPAQAFISPVFGLKGERYLILEGPRDVLEGNLLVSCISDEEGFRECHLLNLKRQQRQELWEHFRQQGLEEWATVPPAYAVRLLQEAYEINPAGAQGAGRYGSLRQKIWAFWGNPQEAPAREDLLPGLDPGDRSRLLEQSRMLVLDPLFLSWLPGREELAPWMEKIREVEESPLVLSDQQRMVRMDAVLDEATQALYPPETRKLWGRRLLDMAFFLDRKGRGEEARAAQTAASDLAREERSVLAGENPFLKGLVQHSLRLARELARQEKGPESPSGLVAPPGESLLLRR